MSEDTSSIIRENPPKTNGTLEKSVIEEDVIPALPSVKALAKVFQVSTENTNVQLNRPKSYSWKSVDVKQQEVSAQAIPEPIIPPVPLKRTSIIVEEKAEPEPTKEVQLAKETEPSKESFSPSYEQKYIPAESPVIPPEINGTISAAEEDIRRPEANEAGLTVSTLASSVALVTESRQFEFVKTEESHSYESVSVTNITKSSHSDNLMESRTVEQMFVDTTKEETQIPKDPCEDSYSPPYERKYIPAEAPAKEPVQEISYNIEKQAEEKLDKSNSLEWKEDNIEIISTPKDEQNTTPPNTPETEDHKSSEESVNPIIESISLPTEIAQDLTMQPSHEPTIVEQFLENEKRSAMPPVNDESQCRTIVLESTKNDSVIELVSTVETVESASSVPTTSPEVSISESNSGSEPEIVSPSTEAAAVVESVPNPAEPAAIQVDSESTDPNPVDAEVLSFMVEQTLISEPPKTLESSTTSTENPYAEKSSEPTLSNGHPTIDTKLSHNGFSEPSPVSPTQNMQTSRQNNAEQRRSEIRFTQESHTKDRPISPVLVPGKLKSSIAFFENLKNKK